MKNVVPVIRPTPSYTRNDQQAKTMYENLAPPNKEIQILELSCKSRNSSNKNEDLENFKENPMEQSIQNAY